MSKTVARRATIILAGHDISQWVTRWVVESEIGEVNRAVVDIMLGEDSPLAVAKAPAIGMRGRYEYLPPKDGSFSINGTPIASHVEFYVEISRPKKATVGRLHLHADSNILTINGTHPWECSA